MLTHQGPNQEPLNEKVTNYELFPETGSALFLSFYLLFKFRQIGVKMPFRLVDENLCQYLPKPVSFVARSAAACLVLGNAQQLNEADAARSYVWQWDIQVNEYPTLHCVN